MPRAAPPGAIVERARAEVAAAVGAAPRQVVFTSGATEANALALTPCARACGDRAPRDGLVVSAIEHPSVLRGHRFGALPVETAAADRDGVIQLAAVAEALARLEARGAARPLVSVMARQQRDRRDPAGRARSPASSTRRAACCTSTRCRRWAAFRSISARSMPI